MSSLKFVVIKENSKEKREEMKKIVDVNAGLVSRITSISKEDPGICGKMRILVILGNIRANISTSIDPVKFICSSYPLNNT